ncbi:MAG: iron ABC transporter permease, partial [Spirochaetota bacterium]
MALSLLPLAAFASKTIGASHGGWWPALRAAFLSDSTARTLRFTLAQAGLSTLSALALGLPGAYLVARFSFPGRKFFLSLAAVPFCLPPLLVVLAF